ncbi:PREDICTED: spermatogenesis-associated protein 9 isoform X2 [Cercocebus atys]|uniref:spermatogenesis-associated protein 9 isoform X2 n=1 Tax=Cercocebus atys TaxID=9531 RepID=UPI0005F489B8|nr:PREDICTED: spermatogenesis-associated protein 9 isoform X2 [Cercocebus atys]
MMALTTKIIQEPQSQSQSLNMVPQRNLITEQLSFAPGLKVYSGEVRELWSAAFPLLSSLLPHRFLFLASSKLQEGKRKVEGIQKAIMDLVDEFKDEFPTILRLSQSNQVRKGSLFEIISFPAKTALTSIIYASYAALIYLAVCANAVLEKIKNIFQEEESIRQNREERENCRKAFSEPVLSEPMFAEGEIKAKPYRSLPEKPDISDYPKLLANKQSNKIQVLHSVFDQSAEMNEQI